MVSHTTDSWMPDRTGIRERRIAAEGVATSDLAADWALLTACTAAGIDPGELDAITHRRNLNPRHAVSVDRLLGAAPPRPARARGL